MSDPLPLSPQTTLLLQQSVTLYLTNLLTDLHTLATRERQLANLPSVAPPSSSPFSQLQREIEAQRQAVLSTDATRHRRLSAAASLSANRLATSSASLSSAQVRESATSAGIREGDQEKRERGRGKRFAAWQAEALAALGSSTVGSASASASASGSTSPSGTVVLRHRLAVESLERAGERAAAEAIAEALGDGGRGDRGRKDVRDVLGEAKRKLRREEAKVRALTAKEIALLAAEPAREDDGVDGTSDAAAERKRGRKRGRNAGSWQAWRDAVDTVSTLLEQSKCLVTELREALGQQQEEATEQQGEQGSEVPAGEEAGGDSANGLTLRQHHLRALSLPHPVHIVEAVMRKADDERLAQKVALWREAGEAAAAASVLEAEAAVAEAEAAIAEARAHVLSMEV